MLHIYIKLHVIFVQDAMEAQIPKYDRMKIKNEMLTAEGPDNNTQLT